MAPAGGANLVGGLTKQRKPSVEMFAFNRQGQVLWHRLAVIASRHQRDGRPKLHHSGQMRPPVGDALRKDRTKHWVAADAVVKAVHKPGQYLVIKTGARHQICGDDRARTDDLGVYRIHGHNVVFAPFAATHRNRDLPAAFHRLRTSSKDDFDLRHWHGHDRRSSRKGHPTLAYTDVLIF